jgi:type IV fimbrial biogenesis protein FimT
MDARWNGYTLQELLISVGLISALMASTVPLLRNPGAATEADRFSLALTQALTKARTLAVASGERITFCASSDGQTCIRHWPGDVELLVFTDRNGDRARGPGDVLHLQQELRLQHATAVWRGSLARPYLRFRVDGSAVEYGRFTYCPASGEPTAFRQLVINRVGRVYRRHDLDPPPDDCSQ